MLKSWKTSFNFATFCVHDSILIMQRWLNHILIFYNVCEILEHDNQREPRHDKTNKVTVRPAKTQISLGIRPVWSESTLYAQWVAKDPRFIHADSEDWSDWADAQADLSLRCAHTHFVGFVMSRLILCLPHFQDKMAKIWPSNKPMSTRPKSGPLFCVRESRNICNIPRMISFPLCIKV